MRLKEIRKERGLTQVQLANLSGLSRRTIEEIERRGDCRISTASQICDVLKISLDELYPQNKEKKPED